MQETEIIKWVVRVDESKPNGQRADLVGFDKEGNEYQFQVKYYDHLNGEWHDAPTDIIVTDVKARDYLESLSNPS